jgi:hypothetical protein
MLLRLSSNAMGKQLLEFGRQVFALTIKVQQHDDDIKTLRRDLTEMGEAMEAPNQKVDRLAEAVRHLALELRHQRETAAQERENQRLQ